ncbi:MAG TPA: nitroreductase family deazaflavin-dependent oxidoreductase [Candidatus Dormibacteraeota bacterium]|nr:nitroreductase family deazaflavin-dependent oxidoreductase [Candidatus Dormibacteraeota bacterium]
MTPSEAAATEKEVRLTTRGRKSGKPHTVTVWISTDGNRLFIRSGQGMKRDWPRNLEANPAATLKLGGQTIKVRARHLTEAAEVRAVAGYASAKYGSYIKPSQPDEPLTPGEQATFELIPSA